MKDIKKLLIAAGILAAAVSCTQEATPKRVTDAAIGITVDADQTRSAEITSENIATELGEFTCDIWLESDNYEGLSGYMPTIPPASQHYVDKATVKYSDGQWKFDGAKQPTWVHNIQSQFWAWAPKTVATRTFTTAPAANAASVAFSYTLPAANGTTDATNQKDLLFAYYEKKFDDEKYQAGTAGMDTDAKLEFKHALAEVRFIVEASAASDIDIAAVKIENVAASGAFTFSKTGTYSCAASGSGTYGQSSPFTGAKAGTAAGKSVFATANNFFMIPQTLGDGAKVTITLKGGDVHSATLKGVKATWESGKEYTYLLSVLGNELVVTLHDWYGTSADIKKGSVTIGPALVSEGEGEDGEQL